MLVSTSANEAVGGDAAAGREAPGGGLRVLVVDDNDQNVNLLSQVLERLGYAVARADGGRSALAAVEAEPPDVILLDVLMPELSGLDVLRALRAIKGASDLPVILVSGLGETEDIVNGLRLGANDYVTKPINLPVLQARLATQAELKRARDELKRSAMRLQAALEQNARELQVAGHVQRSILPQRPPAAPGLATAWCYEPATEVGGDLFDVVPLADGRTLLFVADAMGHGVQAALVASVVKATLAAHLDLVDDLSALLSRLDVTIAQLFEDRFVTAAACVVDPRAQRLTYALAGHPPPLLARRDGEVGSLEAGGLPLGTALGQGFRGGEALIAPGDGLLLYSDGLTEALSPDGGQLGLEVVSTLFARSVADGPEAAVLSLRRLLDQYRGGVPLVDDLTILAARAV